ncbi:proprotein convertase P-domain-containing protein [Rhizohabitans arisaemae]|uniref:proprotein convertase P-domain-containing protein n=1 Tax=Rhizohabitans arisaemae TaxID=2720610 RepID=UPI0024B09DF8|nr:proprotein convertase P-domain-containing protein [Rhizohabitans arisaemae]
MRFRGRFWTATAVGALVLSAGMIPTAASAAPPSLNDTLNAAMLQKSQNKAYAANAVGEKQTQVSVQRENGAWAFGTSGILAPSGQDTYPEAWIFVARNGPSGWKVALEGTPEFAGMIAQSPDGLVGKAEKKTFANHTANALKLAQAGAVGAPEAHGEGDGHAHGTDAAGGAAAAAPIQTGLMLPFAEGDSWAIIGGPHGWSGQSRPFSSIDLNKVFGSGAYQILAAQSGRAYDMCNNGGHVRIIHDNGWTTEYYHLANEIRPTGQQIAKGTYLGMTSVRIPCGGSAGSNHVHFAIKQGTSWVPLAGKIVGGWDYYEGAQAYGGGARRNGVSVGVRGKIQNYGTGTGEPPTGNTFENADNYNIPDRGQVESPISVTGVPGTKNSVTVYADVHHTWIGDVQLDLIAPDGSTYRVKNSDANDSGDILHQTYTISVSNETANGTWKLRATDVSVNDSGYIDAWKITI